MTHNSMDLRERHWREGVPVHVWDLCEVAIPTGCGFYYSIPLDPDTGDYIEAETEAGTTLIGPYLTAYHARDAALAFVDDVVHGANLEEANFNFVDEVDLANMDAKGTA